ncbi:hypothetical protein [Anaerobutyricum hallii]|uniref:hypothetical protein n=1 Tax=Anaerobutyricum hallii TaxID=39488 RepID=UPI0035214ED0
MSIGKIKRNKQESIKEFWINPREKIKIFISSKCGDKGKYDNIRKELKKAIENTNLVKVYLFEEETASTLTASQHYLWALEDSDVCLFLIDNKDGIPEGVQKEIDTAQKYKIKSLYYFCDERSTEKTVLEQSLMGATFAKSKTVHKFDDLLEEGFQAIINDIITVYLSYCRGRLVSKTEDDDDTVYKVEIIKDTNYREPIIPKTVIENIDKCKDYILKKTVGFSSKKLLGEDIKTSQLDEWGVQFLSVLFDRKSIMNFNTGMFLETLKELHNDDSFKIVSLRWQAIQSYFMDNIEDSVKQLTEALNIAKLTEQPTWIIQDILIDLRNQYSILDAINNRYGDSSAQKELDENDEAVYYPILDRINNSLQEKYIKELYKEKIKSPYSITLGNNFDQYGSLLASTFIIAFYNGSLTHIVLFYNKIKEFLFYLTCKYSNWNIRRDLFKLVIFSENESEIERVKTVYPEILNNMNGVDAAEIMEFCNNQPISFKRMSSQLKAFGAVGYYLNDTDYAIYEAQILNNIKEWVTNEKKILAMGINIFKCLSEVAERISQDTLAEICCIFMENNYVYWFTDMFKFIAKKINLNKMNNSSAKKLIQNIMIILDNKDKREQIEHAPHFMYALRKQNEKITEPLDKKIAEYFPQFYNDIYRLETTKALKDDFPQFIQKYVEKIKENNDEQGKNGRFFGHGTRYIETIRNILLDEKCTYSAELMDELIIAVKNTLLISKEGLPIKLDAVNLMICIIVRYPEDYKRNIKIFNEIIEQKENIKDTGPELFSSNIDEIALKIAVVLLEIAMGQESYAAFLEYMSYIQNDIPTILSVERLLITYLDLEDTIQFPKNIEIIVLQNILQWLREDSLEVRFAATKLLFMLIRNPENSELINQKIVELVNTDCVYIKNLIIRQMYRANGISGKTQDYIISKCKNDSCFVVRMACKEVQDNYKIQYNTTV